MRIGWVRRNHRQQANKGCKLNPPLVAELGSVFYSVKEKNFDDRGTRRTADREFSKRAELEMEMAKQREESVFYLSSTCIASEMLSQTGLRKRLRMKPLLLRRRVDLLPKLLCQVHLEMLAVVAGPG